MVIVWIVIYYKDHVQRIKVLKNELEKKVEGDKKKSFLLIYQ